MTRSGSLDREGGTVEVGMRRRGDKGRVGIEREGEDLEGEGSRGKEEGKAWVAVTVAKCLQSSCKMCFFYAVV